MTRITPEELIYLLESQDRDATYLFVEGDRDVHFWGLLVPTQSRGRSTVTPIRTVECVGVEDGERGRAIWLARILNASPVRDRVRFFLDADNDALLPTDIPDNVILTDFRDLEAYAANDNSFRNLLYAHGRNPDGYAELRDDVFHIGRVLGVARVVNYLRRVGVSFKEAFLSRPGRVLAVDAGRLALNRSLLLARLFATTALSRDEAEEFDAEVTNLEIGFAYDDPRMLLCGKDFAAILATIFNVQQADAYRSIHQALAADLATIRVLPQVAAAETFARA